MKIGWEMRDRGTASSNSWASEGGSIENGQGGAEIISKPVVVLEGGVEVWRKQDLRGNRRSER